MKKILFVVEAMGGGVFTYIVDLANKLSDSYDVYIAYGIRNQTPENYKQYFDERIHLIKVRNFTRSINLKKDFLAYRELKKIELQVNPDIIHLHSSKAGVLGRFAFKRFSGSVYYTPHGYSFLMRNTSPIKRKLYLLIEEICANVRGTTIACSFGEYKAAKSITNSVTYVSNGINISNLKKISKNIKGGSTSDYTVATLGRITTQKNPIMFNKIAKALPNVKFKWIGNGNLSHQLTSPNITITGWLNRKSALKELMSADVFLLTSLWEGLPMSLLEAMFLGKVCVVSNVVGNNDVIEDHKNGFICDNISECVNILRKIRDSQVDVDNIKKNALSDILNVYNTDVMAKKYINIYENGEL